MAQLREGSVIKKPTGDEVIATVEDIKKKQAHHVGEDPPEDNSTAWIDTSL